MVTSAKIVGLVEVMAQNLSKENSPSLKVEHTGEDAQALLRQLMAIYDVKTLVAPVSAVFATVLKRLAGNACLPANGINMRCAHIKPTGTAILSSIVSMKMSAM